MSVGLLAVQLLYRFYFRVHLSIWFTFFSVFSRLFLVVVVFLRLLVTFRVLPSGGGLEALTFNIAQM